MVVPRRGNHLFFCLYLRLLGNLCLLHCEGDNLLGFSLRSALFDHLCRGATSGAYIWNDLLVVGLHDNKVILQNKERREDIHRNRNLLKLATTHFEQDIAYHTHKDAIGD